MGRPALYSFLLHVVVFLLLFFGIPWFPQEQPESMHAIPVEVMTIAEETMAPKPTVTPVKEEPKIEEKKPEPQPEPEKQTPPPSPAPEPEPQPEEPTPAPVAPPEPPKPEPLPTPDPAPKPEIKEPAPEPQAKPVPPKPKEKDKPKKQEKQEKQEKPKDKKPEKKKKEDSFDSILKNLEDLKQKVVDDSDASTDPDAPAPARQVGKVGDALTISEIDLLGSHFKKCWSIPFGAQGAEDLVIPIRLSVTSDGMVKDAEIVDKGRFGSDPYYRSAAEAALRAAKDPRCAKLPLSPEKIKKYSSIKLNFNPKDLLGG